MTTDTENINRAEAAADELLADVLGTHEGQEHELSLEERRKRIKDHNDHARKKLALFGRTMTQGDWLTICRELDMTRAEIGEDQNLALLAFAYVKERRTHGAASLSVLLEYTDRQLLAAHDFVSDPDDDEDDDDDSDD